ncbi:hypothetical protein GCM10007932_47090 [Vibrio penaeicida]|uniref:Uncharacterized protein n=1 Tax=Vibrio penaeicida TaxID=104609 RepID=A0AAV5NZ76_9VIBR|nr:hypothetical protein GCM10007932_47090 [Vibrio penaeicida]
MQESNDGCSAGIHTCYEVYGVIQGHEILMNINDYFEDSFSQLATNPHIKAALLFEFIRVFKTC